MKESEVAAAAFDLLYGEFVRSMIERSEATPDGELSDLVVAKLEAAGYDVGYRFVESCTKERPRLVNQLERIKFVCKEFWHHVFSKPIDKLQTNHKGVYVLQDSNFRWLRTFSSSSSEQTYGHALNFLIFPCGVIRGALANLGIEAAVNADIGEPSSVSLPLCTCGSLIL